MDRTRCHSLTLFRFGIGVSVFLFLCRCSPQEQSSTALLLPADLHATLWAESPMLFNPTNMDCDSEGRLWVTEGVNYRNYNNDSSEFYHHPKGDRIVILEDTDNDGKADVSKVFVQDEDLISPLGIAVVGNKIYVSCSPHLIVYTDENADDKPDSKEILLTGFGGVDHDHSLHSLVGGPDGNLYFTTGNAGPHNVTDKDGWTLRSGSIYTGGSPYNTTNEGNQVSDDGKIWVGGLTLRIAPDGSAMKVLAHNFRNSYEVYVDSRGNLWQNDNDDQVVACRTAWIMEGGNSGYFSEDGTRTWQADHRPGQEVFTAHWHQDDPGVMPAGDNTGAGSPTGIVMIEGNELGEQYQGMLLSADAGRNTIFGYRPERQASGYAPGERLNLITSLQEDNIGYVWNDTSNLHDVKKWFRPSDVTVGTDGALYVADWYDPVVGGHQLADTTAYGRIYRITPRDKRLIAPELDLSTTSGQVEAFKSPAINVRFDAASRLRANGGNVIEDVKRLIDADNPFIRDRAVWLMSSLGPNGVAEVEALLNHSDDEVRMVALRALRQTTSSFLSYARKMANDPSAMVRREVLVSLNDVAFEEKKEIVVDLARRYESGDKPYLNAVINCVDGFEDQVYEAWLMDRPPLEWSAAETEIAWGLRANKSAEAWEERVTSQSVDSAATEQALTALAFIRNASAARTMQRLTSSDDPLVSDRATYWLSFRQANDWADVMDWKETRVDVERARQIAVMKVKIGMVANSDLPLNERRWHARDLAKNPIGAQMLIGRLDELNLPAEVLSVIETNLLQNPDLNIRIQAGEIFSASVTSTAISIPEVLKIGGDPDSGRVTFERYCMSCHRFAGQGSQLAPDLTNIGQKFDSPALLDAIVNPGAGIAFGYEPWKLETDDGLSYYGFLVGQTAETITIKDLTGKLLSFNIDELALKEQQQRSAMPDPQTMGLTNRQLADLVRYLRELP